MPRKENLSIEERLERARELFTHKQHEKHKEISHLYKTKIYRLAKKSSIAFLWIAQLIFIDWSLPYLKVADVITSGYRVNYSKSDKHTATDFYVTIGTQKCPKLELFLASETIEPQVGDSIIILKSLLLHDAKKVNDLNRKETYLVSSSITYLLLPLIIISSVLSLLFLFVKNIEVKSFYYFMFITNIAAALVLIFYYLK
ncbi:MAG TPA: hypothetical protein VK835_15350 [Bacteroidia bacterium]|nr:hypothetical protein [Bacteroidia bacterium]